MEYPSLSYKAKKKLKIEILDHSFRKYNFLMESLSISRFAKILHHSFSEHDISEIQEVLNNFSDDWKRYKIRFQLTTKLLPFHGEPHSVHDLMEYRFNVLQQHLKELYHVAPIFNLQRATHNAKVLLTMLDQKNYCPVLSTQLALILFVTDTRDSLVKEGKKKPILQVNIRNLCKTSAYAFHRARNKLGISRF